MYQLRDVDQMFKKHNPKTNFNSCDDFFEIVITAHILAAALEALGMKSLGDTLSEEILPSPEMAWMGSEEERREKLKEI